MRFRVKELAQRQKLTQEQLAQKSGLTSGTVYRIWNNRASDPSYRTLKAIADALGVTVDELEDRGGSVTSGEDSALDKLETPCYAHQELSSSLA